MQSLPAVVGQGLQKDAGPVNFPVHKVVQPQISVLQALQRLEGLGNLRYRVLVRRANSQQSPGAGIVDFGEYVAQMPPSILGPAGYKFIGSLVSKKYSRTVVFPKPEGASTSVKG